MNNRLKAIFSSFLSIFLLVITCGITISHVHCPKGEKWVLGSEMPLEKECTQVFSKYKTNCHSHQNQDNRSKETFDLNFCFDSEVPITKHFINCNQFVAIVFIPFEKSLYINSFNSVTVDRNTFPPPSFVKPDVIVFLDGDYSDYPQELPLVVAPILNDNVDLVIGSRALGNQESGSMTFPQRFGNWLSTRMMHLFYGVKYSDLGPFRAMRFDKLLQLNMSEMTFGWTIEMQIKAAKHKMKSCEVPVNYKVRIGESKVSGTLKGAVMAGIKIIWSIFKYKFVK